MTLSLPKFSVGLGEKITDGLLRIDDGNRKVDKRQLVSHAYIGSEAYVRLLLFRPLSLSMTRLTMDRQVPR